MLAVLVLLFLVVALTGYLIGVYNGLVRVRAAVKLTWSNIDVLLVQRHDELPKLVEVCRQYMQFEAGTLERVDRKSTRLNSSHSQISYAVFCLKKKTQHNSQIGAVPVRHSGHGH